MMATARFWAETLGYEVDGQDDEGKYVALKGPSNEPYVAIQRVDHDSRIHIDIETDDKEAEAARLESSAPSASPRSRAGSSWKPPAATASASSAQPRGFRGEGEGVGAVAS